MSRANPLWGAPRIHGELLKLGLTVSQATVSKYMLRPRRPPSQTWRAFLKNHAADLIAVDFFAVPTATFRVLFVFVMLTHRRRWLVHFNVTEHPTAEWTARQLLEACGLEGTPRYLIRDRDGVYGARFSRQAKTLNIREAVIAPRSPWQNGYAERVIGSIRRECLDHVVVIGERHLLVLSSKWQRTAPRTLSTGQPEHPLPQQVAKRMRHLARLASVADRAGQAPRQAESIVDHLQQQGAAIGTGLRLIEPGNDRLRNPVDPEGAVRYTDCGHRASTFECREASRHRFYSTCAWLGGSSLSSFVNFPG
jgi:transposase InsO family protein